MSTKNSASVLFSVILRSIMANRAHTDHFKPLSQSEPTGNEYVKLTLRRKSYQSKI
ncbi:hypothetical protein C0J52_09730 [Blattella germanica]|nr:hypothetical protein C0J52_09730 [Blattella germanica]